MQTAGLPCGICLKHVITAFEASWCARCKTVVHLECLTGNGNFCPSCQTTIDRAEAHFVFSRKCPDCFAPNLPPVERCRVCGEWTRWDDEASYRQFTIRMNQAAADSLKRGWLEIFGGVFCLFLFMLIFFLTTKAPFLILPGALLLMCFGLIGDGANRIRLSKIFRNFE